MGFYNHWRRSKWLCRPVPNDSWQFDERQVNHSEHQLIYVCIKKWQMTIIVQVPKTEAAVKIDWAKVIFRPQGTWQNSPASCAMSCVMALLREVQVNYIRNSKMPLWCCDMAEVVFFFLGWWWWWLAGSHEYAAAVWAFQPALMKWAAALPLPAMPPTKLLMSRGRLWINAQAAFLARQEQDCESLD